MYLVTTLSFDELGTLIRDKRISLDNGELLFGDDIDTINEYFKERIGFDGYVIGLRGRINRASAGIFQKIDRRTMTGEHVIIEAEIDDNDVLRYNVNGINMVAQALSYGMSEDAIYDELDSAQLPPGASGKVEVLCVPYIKGDAKVRVTSLSDKLDFAVEGITYVNLSGIN